MMAILIKGMQMPKSCMECPLSYRGMRCLIPGNWKDRYNCPEDERSDACPLQEIPKGAMLIDANEIEEKISFGLQEPDYQHECESWVMGLLMARDYVENASIIFEEDDE
jgi:hypothetical protein